MILLGDHSSCTSRRCEVCPARDNSENPSKNSDPVAEDFSFENENRELPKQEMKKEPSEENSEKVHSEQDSDISDVDDDDSENSSEDDEAFNGDEDKAELIRVIKVQIGELESQNREKYEQYCLQPTLLEQMDFYQVRKLMWEINAKYQLQIVEHQERLNELEARRKLQAMVEKIRSKIAKLLPEEKNEFNDYMQNNIKELEMPLENLDESALEVLDFKLEDFFKKREVTKEKEERICKLRFRIDQMSDDSKSSIFYHIKIESLEKLPDEHLKHLENKVQKDMSRRNIGLIITVENFMAKLLARDRNAHNDFIEYARINVPEDSEPFGLDSNDKITIRLNLMKLDARILELLISKAQRLLTRLDKRRRKSSHEEESRPKKKSRNEL